MTTQKQLSKIQRKREKMLANLWPNHKELDLWHKKNTSGWLTVPRTMPLIMRILDSLAPKGKPVSQTYVDLWCRTYEDSFVIVNKPREMAFHSGFSGERAESTWGSRVKILAELEFLEYKSGISPIHYILLMNPHRQIEKLHAEGKLSEQLFNTFQERMIDIGAYDDPEVIEGTG